MIERFSGVKVSASFWQSLHDALDHLLDDAAVELNQPGLAAAGSTERNLGRSLRDDSPAEPKTAVRYARDRHSEPFNPMLCEI